MVLTEAEAAQRWCPLVRVMRKGDMAAEVALAAVNTDPYTTHDSREGRELCCVGSRCMMWRWDDPPLTMNGSTNSRRRGYCGIAGAVKVWSS